MQYFYAIDDRQQGPVSFEQLKQMASRDEVKRGDKVWCKGMAAWQPADSVPGLLDGLPPDLKPILTVNTPPPLADGQDAARAEATSHNGSKNEWGFWLRAIGIALLIFAVYWKIRHHMYWGQSESQVQPAATEAANQAAAREKSQAELLERVKTELSTAGILDVVANKATPYIMGRLNSAEPLSPEAAAQASALGIIPIPFSQTVIDEYSNWVQETTGSEAAN